MSIAEKNHCNNHHSLAAPAGGIAIESGLGLLLWAYEAGRGSLVTNGCVPIHSLRAAGLIDEDFRWLFARGFAKEAVLLLAEASLPTAWPDAMPVVLTEQGRALAARICQKGSMVSPPLVANRPRWTVARRRELWVGKVLVKSIRVPATQQDIIFAAFEEQGWPPSIKDPLPPQRGVNAKRRLSDAIKRLNRHQKQPVLRFFGNGYGDGICWELSKASDT
jgi:hypothetical protein